MISEPGYHVRFVDILFDGKSAQTKGVIVCPRSGLFGQ